MTSESMLEVADMIIKEKSGMFKCSECNKEYTKRYTTGEHIVKIHKDSYKKFHCEFPLGCDEYSHNRKSLIEHMKIHDHRRINNDELPLLRELISSMDGMLHCKKCEYKDEKKQNTVNHIINNHIFSYKKLYCRYEGCKEFGHSEEVLIKHGNKKHKTYIKPPIIVVGPATNALLPEVVDIITKDGYEFVCMICDDGLPYKSRTGVVDHITTIHKYKYKRFYCEFPGCGDDAVSNHALRLHANNTHNGEGVPNDEIMKLSDEENNKLPTIEEILVSFDVDDKGNHHCNICKKNAVFTGKHARKTAREHIRSIHMDKYKKFYCSKCGYKNGSQCGIDNHMLDEHPENEAGRKEKKL
jgi:hypothetical protein